MECPECRASKIVKNGRIKGKQNYICKDCGRQFIDNYEAHRGYPPQIKQQCLSMYVNGMGFRAIERVTGVHNTTVLDWVKQVGENLPDYYNPEQVPSVGELDELETFVGSKKIRFGTGCAVDHFKEGILGWVLGNHSAETFRPLWETLVSTWKCYFYVTDGWVVYPMFIPDGDQIVSKTYMTRVESENTRLRHYLARLTRKTLCYSKCEQMLKHFIRLLIHYLKFDEVPIPVSISSGDRQHRLPLDRQIIS
jgi:insertion element IS1 protein InsB